MPEMVDTDRFFKEIHSSKRFIIYRAEISTQHGIAAPWAAIQSIGVAQQTCARRTTVAAAHNDV